MTLLDFDLDWHNWYKRWQAQQNCYVLQRLYRFDLMFRWPNFPRDAEVQILNLGCGPGTLAFRALEHYPQARVVAVDHDPVLLAIGQHVAENTTDRIQFVEADIRDATWWGEYVETFDLVVSATALHWLSAENLAKTYRRVYKVLKPGSWLMNSDHVASEDAQTQTRYREMRRTRQEAAFRESGADDWDAFWDRLGHEVGQVDLRELRNADEYWEGSDDGHPKSFHIESLRQCGFAQVEILWEDLGEAVISALKES